MNPLLAEISAKSLRQEALAPFNVGDSVSVHYRIKEGDKERIQLFSGTVIRKSEGHGDINATFTVRRLVDGEGVERVFPVHSPKVAKVEVTREGRVRRAKLYYLRDRVGKATKVKEKIRTRHDKEAATH
jgi:large subunit ribosomal protein L19